MVGGDGLEVEEQIGLLIAVVVLLFAFGSVIAMLLPIGMALFAPVVGETLIAILAASTNVPTWASALAAMIGLGVGIDYSLFIVTRFREARRDGRSVVDAAAQASATAGSAVLFAGTSVVIAISGLLISGIWAVGLLGLAAAMVVAVSVVSALTLLPALLGLLGGWVDRLRVPLVGRRRPRANAGLSTRWAGGVTRHPVAAALAGTLALVALAAPVVDMRLGQADQGSQPPETSQRQAYDLLADGFGPGFNGPLLMVATVPDDTARQGLEALRAEVRPRPVSRRCRNRRSTPTETSPCSTPCRPPHPRPARRPASSTNCATSWSPRRPTEPASRCSSVATPRPSSTSTAR